MSARLPQNGLTVGLLCADNVITITVFLQPFLPAVHTPLCICKVWARDYHSPGQFREDVRVCICCIQEYCVANPQRMLQRPLRYSHPRLSLACKSAHCMYAGLRSFSYDSCAKQFRFANRSELEPCLYPNAPPLSKKDSNKVHANTHFQRSLLLLPTTFQEIIACPHWNGVHVSMCLDFKVGVWSCSVGVWTSWNDGIHSWNLGLKKLLLIYTKKNTIL